MAPQKRGPSTINVHGQVFVPKQKEKSSHSGAAEAKVTIRPPEYKPPPGRTYTDLGWLCAALTGPATLLAVWIYCVVTYGFWLGFFLGWIPALVLGLLVAGATIFLWPLPAAAILYVVYRVFGINLNIAAALIGIFAIGVVWWWHMVRTY
jgi:hypothetical protein